MDKYEIQKLRDLPIEGVAERLGLRVKRHQALCPYHDDHSPSFYFNVRKNLGRCFSCGTSGIGTIDLTMHMLGLSFLDACRWLANDNNVILSEYRPRTASSSSFSSSPAPAVDIAHLSRLITPAYLSPEARAFLFDQRRIHPAVVRWLGLSSISYPAPMTGSPRGPWFNAPSLLIPYKDVEGKLLSVQARYLGNTFSGDTFSGDNLKIYDNSRLIHDNLCLNKNLPEASKNSFLIRSNSCLKQKQFPRFQFPRGSHCHIFNLPVLKLLRPGEDLYLAEGSSDCMALLSAGHKSIAIPSATLLNRDDMLLLKQYASSSRLIIYPDRNAAGERLYSELLRLATELRLTLIRRDLPADCKDFGEFWKNNTN